jgi:hypothetical protein
MLAKNTLRWSHLAESCALLPLPLLYQENKAKERYKCFSEIAAIMQKVPIHVGIDNGSTR